MHTPFSRRRFLGGTVLALALGAGLPASASHRIAKSRRGVAIGGYDTTAYFTVQAARPGAAPHAVVWRDATWQFTTAEDAARFAAQPEAFAPQFGGFCTRAMSLRQIVPADPEVWRIYGDKLYMFAKPLGGTVFDKGQDAMIAKAQAYWDTLD